MNKSMKSAVGSKILAAFIVFMFATQLSLFAQNSKTPLSLKAAVDSALNHNPKIRQYKEVVLQKEAEVKVARGNYLPSLNASGGYTYLSKKPEVNMSQVKQSLGENVQKYASAIAQNGVLPPATLAALSAILQGINQMPAYNIAIDQQHYPDFNVAALQPLYMGGKIRAGVRYAKADVETAKVQLKQVKNETIRKTIKSYYGVVLLKAVIKTRQNVLAGMQKHERQAEKALKTGIIPDQDLLRAKVAVANAELALSDDQNKLTLAELALQTDMGIRGDFNFVLPDNLKFIAIPFNLQNLKEEAKLHQPVFEIIDQKEMMVKQQRAVDRAAFLPQVAAWGSYSAFQNQYPIIMPPVMVGVQAKINIFNGFKKFNQLKATRHLKDQVEEARNNAMDQINLWVSQSYLKALNARQRYLKMQPVLALISRNLMISEKRFQEGLSKSIDVIDSRLLDEKSQTESLQALYSYDMALSDVYFATGEPEKAVQILNR